MNRFAAPSFWDRYQALPESTRVSADTKFQLLKSDPSHPSLRLKHVGRFYSVRIGLAYRAPGVEVSIGILKTPQDRIP